MRFPKFRPDETRLLLAASALYRAGLALLVWCLLWSGYFWATGTPGTQ
jgi:hypothetical protein